jgi:adenosylcobinamide amidohydrolase
LHEAVGLLTSRDLAAHVVQSARHGDVVARCVATVGLGNALRAGDAPVPGERAGTINVLCHVSVPLSELASLEALALAAEARTCALLEAGLPSRTSGQPATGTGTDCIVIASPLAEGASAQAYAGKHTAVGHVIGAAVHAALCEGIAGWLAQYGAGRAAPA